jgi:diguanylate cyclase (GGDEF)-like protein
MEHVAASWFVVGMVLAIVSSSFVGSISDVSLAVLTFGGVISIAVGIRRNRPEPAGPWWKLFAAGLLFAVAGAVRSAVSATGDLSSSRSLVPDAFALPGYLLFAAGLLELLRSRRRSRERFEDTLDAAMLAIGSLVLVWVVLLGPLLSGLDAAPMARLSVAIYPPISAFLVSIAARLAFTSGRRSISYSLLLGGLGIQMVGDVIYFLVETHRWTPPGTLVNLPYAISFTLIATAALHPSIRQVSSPRPARLLGFPVGRAALVAVAMMLPSVLVALWNPPGAAEQGVVGALVLALALGAVLRILVALRDQSLLSAQLSYQARHDPLTALPSRSLIVEHIDWLLAAAGRNGPPVTVMYIDIDQFKLVNDTLGHSTGDGLLTQAGERIRAAVRPGDLVGRQSGDEFVVVAAGLDVFQAKSLAERVRLSFCEPLAIGVEFFVTVSVGIVLSTGHETASDLLRDADTAMYKAKDKGRNSVVVFDVAMRELLARRVALESELRKALNNGELDVHYQPVVSMVTGDIEGFEALARWSRDGRPVPPPEFIQVAEESGLIVQLGEYVLHEACRRLSQWRGRYGDLSMSVNVSAHQLQSTDLVQTVADVLATHEIPGESLWLEITETVMMHDTVDNLSVLAALRDLGTKICMDDFGTGFSSLSYLQRFPIDRFKIDRSFVWDLGPDRSEALVRAMIAIGRELGMDIVAEGIETEEQFMTLRALGCPHGQGYLFSRPVSAVEMTAQLERSGRRTLRVVPSMPMGPALTPLSAVTPDAAAAPDVAPAPGVGADRARVNRGEHREASLRAVPDLADLCPPTTGSIEADPDSLVDGPSLRGDDRL